MEYPERWRYFGNGKVDYSGRILPLEALFLKRRFVPLHTTPYLQEKRFPDKVKAVKTASLFAPRSNSPENTPENPARILSEAFQGVIRISTWVGVEAGLREDSARSPKTGRRYISGDPEK